MVALLSHPPKCVYRLRGEHKACRLGLGTPTRHPSFSQGQGENCSSEGEGHCGKKEKNETAAVRGS